MNAIRDVGEEGAYQILERFAWLLRDGDNPTELWRRSIGLWVLEHWPPEQTLRSATVFGAAAELAIETRAAFPEAVDTLRQRNLVGPMTEAGMFLGRIRANGGLGEGETLFNLAAHYPRELALWLDEVLPRRLQPWEARELNRIATALESHGAPSDALEALRERLL